MTKKNLIYPNKKNVGKSGCLLLFAFAWLAGVHYTAMAEETQQTTPDNWFTLSTFVSGERYFIRKDSFEPIGKGILRYQVIGEPGKNGGEPRISENEVDCSTGRFRSPIASWAEKDTSSEGLSGKSGDSTMIPGPAFPMSLTNRTPLYRLLKNKCEEYAPVSW